MFEESIQFNVVLKTLIECYEDGYVINLHYYVLVYLFLSLTDNILRLSIVVSKVFMILKEAGHILKRQGMCGMNKKRHIYVNLGRLEDGLPPNNMKIYLKVLK